MIKTSVNTGQTLILIAASTLLFAGAPVRASQTDDRIESSAKKSYVFKHYLTDDSIKIESKNGAVTLTGTVAEDSHIGLARDTVSGLPDVKSVDNLLTVKGEAPAEHSDTWIGLKVKTALLFHRNVSAGQDGRERHRRNRLVERESLQRGPKGADDRIRQRCRRRQRGEEPDDGSHEPRQARRNPGRED